MRTHPKTKSAFLKKCRNVTNSCLDVEIDTEAVASYANGLSIPDFIPDWKEYVAPESFSDLRKAFFDLAVNCAQNCGYYAQNEDGSWNKWEKEGSGAKALAERFTLLREKKLLPNYDRKAYSSSALEEAIIDMPFKDQRMAIFKEFTSSKAQANLNKIFDSAAQKDGSFRFTYEHVLELAKAFPNGFGEDPYLKKAFLLPILFAGLAHAHNVKVETDGCIPSDYRVPQTLHNIGVLRFSDALIKRIENKQLTENDIDTIRAASIVAVQQIQNHCPDLQLHHIDGELWYAGRKPESLDKFWEKIGAKTNFKNSRFTQRTKAPMVVETMRF